MEYRFVRRLGTVMEPVNAAGTPCRRRACAVPRHPLWGEILPPESGSGARQVWAEARFGDAQARVYLPLDGSRAARPQPALEVTVRLAPPGQYRSAACVLTWEEACHALALPPHHAAWHFWGRLAAVLGPFPAPGLVRPGADILEGEP